MSLPTSDGGIPAARVVIVVVVVDGGRWEVGLVGVPGVRVAVEVRGVAVLRAVDVREDPVLAAGDVPVAEDGSAEGFVDEVGVGVIEEVGRPVGDVGVGVIEEVGRPVDDEAGDGRPAVLHAPATIANATMRTGAHRWDRITADRLGRSRPD